LRKRKWQVSLEKVKKNQTVLPTYTLALPASSESFALARRKPFGNTEPDLPLRQEKFKSQYFRAGALRQGSGRYCFSLTAGTHNQQKQNSVARKMSVEENMANVIDDGALGVDKRQNKTIDDQTQSSVARVRKARN